MAVHNFSSNLVFLILAVMSGLVTQEVTSSQLTSPCDVAGCWCPDGRGVSGSEVICNVKFVSNKSKIIRYLPSKSGMKSLFLRCETTKYKSHLGEKLLARFSNLERLTVHGCAVETFHPGVISNASSLQELHFQHVTFTVTQLYFLSNTLKRLVIAHSVLPQFPSIFDCTSLENVTIAHNKVSDASLMPLVKEAKTVLSNLKNLSLADNGITFLPPSMFSFLPALVVFQFSQNFIRDISFPPDSDLSNLQILDGVGNPLESVDTRALISSRNLHKLRIHGVGQPIDLEFLSFLQSPVDLQLSNFNLNSSIWDLLRWPSLERLDLSHNQLTSLNLSALPSLKVVLLQCNAIAHLPHDAFVLQNFLRLLNLSQNVIESVPESVFVHNPNLKAVLLTSNAIRSLPGKLFFQAKQLFYIHLTNNSLKTLPVEIFSKLNNLLYLYLDNNGLVSFPSFPPSSNLTHLFISNNSISSLNYSHFQPLSKLLLLQMDYNHVRWIETGLFSSCPQLLQVSFKNNRIQRLGSFGDHPSLQVLIFDNNQISSFSSFSRMKSLRILFLDNNDITNIPGNSFPKTIRVITLSFNRLHYIRRDSFANLPVLETVNIIANKLVLSIYTASLSVFNENVVKPTFNLGYSVFKCDCNMGYLKVWLSEMHSNVVDWEFMHYYPRFIGLDKAYCVSDNFPGEERPLLETPIDYFICNYTATPLCYHDCKCCEKETACYCYLKCPEKCQCYHGGSRRREMFYPTRCDKVGLTSIPSHMFRPTTHLLLSGNFFDTIFNDSFTNITQVLVLNLNGSRISKIEDGAFDGMSILRELRLNDNRIQKITSRTFGNISTLIHLYLDRNRIQTIEMSAFEGLASLETLYLDSNELMTLNPVLSLPSLKAVTLASNPWSCACGDGWGTIKYLATISSIIVDKNAVCCDTTTPLSFSRTDYVTNIENRVAPSSTQQPPAYSTNNQNSAEGLRFRSTFEKVEPESETLSWVTGSYTDAPRQTGNGAPTVIGDTCYQLTQLDANLLCTLRYNDSILAPVASKEALTARLMPPLICLAIFLALVAIAVVLLLWKRSIVQAWLYAKVGVRILDKKAAADREDRSKGSKPFDAFISFSQKDVGYVVNTLVPALEGKRYRLCVHYRDFPVGGDICTIVQRAIKFSNRTILVVSPHFLKSDWCRFEFQTAHHHVLQKGCHRLILVILGDLPQDEIDPDLRVQLKTKTYLNSDDPWFWEKLFFALPDIKARIEANDGQEDNALKGMEILSREAYEADVVLDDADVVLDDADVVLDKEKLDRDEDNDKRGHMIEVENGAFELQDDEIRNEQWWGNVTVI